MGRTVCLAIGPAWTVLLLCAATRGEQQRLDSAESLCEDRDDRWQVHGSSCKKMSSMCDDDSYGELVQAWCPVTCGRCQAEKPRSEGATDATGLEIAAGENLTLPRSEDKALEGFSLDNTSKFFGNSSNSTAEGNATCPAQLGDADLSFQNVSRLNEAKNTDVSLRNFSDARQRSNTSRRMLNVSREKAVTAMSTGKAMLLLEELESRQVRLPLIASQFDFLGKDAFSLNFLKMEANQSSNETSNHSIGNRSLVAEILDLLSPATAQDLEEEEKHCPEGWERVIGDVYGGDQFSGGWTHSANSIEDCAWRCLRQPGCGSFEWSPSQKKCFRNSQTRPTHEVERQDFRFCRRQPCPSFKTKEACVGPGIASGYYSKEVSMRAGSYCIWSAGHCQAPMACTDNDCFLPDGGLPGMELPRQSVMWLMWLFCGTGSRYTLWISRLGLQATMAS
ncbi:unnamed protein product [Cladocopium goreaui]|uniref:ShKT domain-containing protein n=1 Tax=Cladocopium goreaui TaxID=2562237 RepID=A0A9P1DPX4_9DINO|nr:unnamed protein product [Cladocopium goreaui]